MKTNNSTVNGGLYILLLLDIACYFISCLLRSTNIRHAITFLGIIIIWMILINNMVNRGITKHLVISTMILILVVLLNVFPTQGFSLYNYLYSTLCYMSFFMVFSIDFRGTLNVRVSEKLRRITFLIVILVVILSVSSVAYLFEDGRQNGAMALGTTNSNLAGILVFLLFCVLQVFMLSAKRKVIYIPFLIYLLYIIWMTKSRTAFIAALFVTVCCLFKKNNFKKWQIFVFMLVPIIFVIVYMFLFNHSALNLQSVELWNKPLFSGRQYTYLEHLSYINNHFRILFGNLGSLYFANAHNGPLVMFCSLGLVGSITSYISIGKQLLYENEDINEKKHMAAFSAILALFVLSCGEGSIFMGAFPGIAFVLVLKSLM